MKILTNALLALTLSISVLGSNANASDAPKLTYDAIAKQNIGHVVYLDFWASWCTPCRKSFPWMNEMQKKYGHQNFKVVSVNVDSDKQLAQQFLVDTPANFSVLYDPNGDLASEMQLKGMPNSFLINAKGVVISAHVGFNDEKKINYEQEIQHLIQVLLVISIMALSGCSSLGVQPWERDLLAKKEMALTSSPIDAALDDHIYFSKEATSGGRSFGGGGCGCN